MYFTKTSTKKQHQPGYQYWYHGFGQSGKTFQDMESAGFLLPV